MSKRTLRLPAISWPLQLALIASAAFYLHGLFWWTEPQDMRIFLRPWFNHIVHFGPIDAFAHPFGNYAPMYLYLLSALTLFNGSMETMYLVKLLSLAGTAFAALGLGRLVTSSGGERGYAALLFILPSVVINAALLAQCDALWAGACVFAVAAMIRGATLQSLVWCGVAIGFKLQAVFLAPFIIGALIGRRVPLWHWLVPAAIFLSTLIPAWLAGWPAWKLLMIYPSQPSWVPFASRLANPWMFGTVFAQQAAEQLYWIGFVAATLAAIIVAALTSTAVNKPRALLALAILSALLMPFLLPKMLERYYFLADLLSLAMAIIYRDRSSVLIAASVQLASFLSLITYMYFFYQPYLALAGTGFSVAAIAMSYRLALREGAHWPRIRLSVAPLRPASAARTAA